MPSIEQLQALLAKEPKDAFLNFGLAMALRSAKRFEEALAQFERTAELSPDYIAAYFQKAQLEAQIERREDARATLERGIARATATGDRHAEGEMREFLAGL